MNDDNSMFYGQSGISDKEWIKIDNTFSIKSVKKLPSLDNLIGECVPGKCAACGSELVMLEINESAELGNGFYQIKKFNVTCDTESCECRVSGDDVDSIIDFINGFVSKLPHGKHGITIPDVFIERDTLAENIKHLKDSFSHDDRRISWKEAIILYNETYLNSYPPCIAHRLFYADVREAVSVTLDETEDE